MCCVHAVGPLLLNASRMRLLHCPDTSPSLCISSLHCQVVAGSKTFTLLPPADIFRMRLRQYASATYKPQGEGAADQVGCSRFGRGHTSCNMFAAGAYKSGAQLVQLSLTWWLRPHRTLCQPQMQEAVVSGTVPLAPVLDPSGETVLWSSIPPAPDAKAAAAAATTAAPASGPAAGAGGATTGAAAANGVRFAIPDLEDSSAGGSSASPLDEEGSEGPGQRLWDPDLFNDPQLPPPIKVTVKAGEALYLPAMWWHHVSDQLLG